MITNTLPQRCKTRVFAPEELSRRKYEALTELTVDEYAETKRIYA
jgi:hypothetical protein